MIAGPYSFGEIKCGLFVRWDFVNCPNHSIRWLRGPESIAFRRTVFAACGSKAYGSATERQMRTGSLAREPAHLTREYHCHQQPDGNAAKKRQQTSCI